MLDLELYTAGNIETLSQVYKYLVLILGDSFIGTVIKITAVWGLLFAILASVLQGRFNTWIYHFLMSYFMFQIFFMPVVRLTIIDTKINRNYVVDNVPFGVGFIASMASTFSYKLTNMIDNVFHTGTVIVWGAGTGSYAAYVDYSQVGYAGMFDYLEMGLKIDPKLVQNKFKAIYEMQSYIEQCFFPYVATLNQTDLDNLRRSTDLLADLRVSNSFLMSYDGQTWTCDEFYNNELVPNWINFVNASGNSPQVLGFADYMINHMVNSINAMTNASLSFNQIITQAGIINMIKESYFTSGLADDMNNRLLAGYAVGRAQEQSKLFGKAMFLWAKKVVPFMQNFLEAFFVILFPFLIILILLPLITFGGVQAAIGYLKVIVWAYLLTPVLAIIDGMIKLQAINKTVAWMNSVGLYGITLGDYGFLMEQADFYPAIAGGAALSAPIWAWMLLKGFEAGVQGVSSLVGSMGSQFVGQEIGATSITRNMTRDVREMQASMQSGLSSFETLSNAGTWMYAENTNLGGLYSSLANYNAHSIFESQFGVRGTVEAITAGSIYGLTQSAGRGLAALNASGGDLNTMMNTAAMSGPSVIKQTPWGRFAFTTDIKGNIVGMEAISRIKSDLLQTNLQTAISQSKTDAINTAWQAIYGNDKTFQKATQAMKTTTEQFLRAMEKGTGIEKSAVIGNSAEVDKAFTKAEELKKSLMDKLHLSEDRAMQFLTDFSTELNIATAKKGGQKLSDDEVREIYEKTAEKYKDKAGAGEGKAGTGVGFGAKGTESFNTQKAWEDIKAYADSRAYQVIQKAAMTYATSDKANFSKLQKDSGMKSEGVSYEELQQYHEKLNKAEQVSAQISNTFSQIQTQGGSLNASNLMGFVNHLAGGDETKQAQILDRIYTGFYNNDTNFVRALGQAFAAYTMQMQGMNDISSGVNQFLTQKQQELLGMVDNKVDNGAKSVNQFYDDNKKIIEDLQKKYNVNPNTNLDAEAKKILGKANENIEKVKKDIEVGKGTINPLSKPPWTKDVEKYTKDPTNPVELVKNTINYGMEHKGYGVGALVGTGASILGTAAELFPAVGRALPVAGAVLGGATIGLAAGATINHFWGKTIYNNFTEPVLDWLGEKTGLWKPIGQQK